MGTTAGGPPRPAPRGAGRVGDTAGRAARPRPSAGGSGRPDRRPPVLGSVVVTAAALVLAACGTGGDDATPATAPTAATNGVAGMGREAGAGMSVDAPRVPPVFGYHDGERVFFIHTEVSDAKIAGLLEQMMGSPVPVVESLARLPDGTLGAVYVFTNGVKPEDTPLGPLNFQPDVFDSAPGDDDYSPLRQIVEVTWNDGSQPEVLTAVQEITAAESAGRLTLEPTGVVVNAPLLTWPGGRR